MYNQSAGSALGIRNINQGIIFDFLTGMALWATAVPIDGEVYHWVARQNIARQLECLQLKPDTVYRHLKELAALGLIDYRKHGKKDCIRLTKKAEAYYLGNKSESEEKPPADPISETNPKTYAGNKSEKPQDAISDINPKTYIGYKSESNSEINPTDTSIKQDIPINSVDDDRPTKSPPPSPENPMTLAWQPGQDFTDRCTMAGLDPERIPADNLRIVIAEFVSYWQTRSDRYTQATWQHKLLQRLIDKRNRGELYTAPGGPDGPGGSIRGRNIATELTDRSWAQ